MSSENRILVGDVGNYVRVSTPFWERAVLSFATCISSSASQYFFLCGEWPNERQMAFRSRAISALSIPRLWRASLLYR